MGAKEAATVVAKEAAKEAATVVATEAAKEAAKEAATVVAKEAAKGTPQTVPTSCTLENSSLNQKSRTNLHMKRRFRRYRVPYNFHSKRHR